MAHNCVPKPSITSSRFSRSPRSSMVLHHQDPQGPQDPQDQKFSRGKFLRILKIIKRTDSQVESFSRASSRKILKILEIVKILKRKDSQEDSQEESCCT